MSKLKTSYDRSSSSTGWFVGIITGLALLAIGYLVFSANTESDEAQVKLQQSTQTLTEKFNMKPVEVPVELYDMPAGAYEVTIPTSTGNRECIASVNTTSGGWKGVVLDCK